MLYLTAWPSLLQRARQPELNPNPFSGKQQPSYKSRQENFTEHAGRCVEDR